MKRAIAALLGTVLAAAGCGDGGEPDTVRLLTHESFLVSEDVLADFTRETGLTIEVFRGGDAGQVVNQAILTAGNPVADVIFGVDTTFLSRILAEDVLLPYRSERLDDVDDRLHADSRVTPIDFGDVCLNYDKAAFVDLEPPTGLRRLADPAYRGMLVVEHPATSSPGLAFLLATIAEFGEGGDYPWQAYWADLRANDVQVTSGWEEAYYGAFSAGGGGDRPIVVSYASSPPAEVVFAETPLDEAPTAVIADGCFRQVEYAGILRGTDREQAARRLIDFMLSERFQEDIPLTMFVFPAVSGTDLPLEFTEHTVIPENPKAIPPDVIEANRDRWIDEWAAIVTG
jgi:thiamine transport system substrate-binding protein